MEIEIDLSDILDWEDVHPSSNGRVMWHNYGQDGDIGSVTISEFLWEQLGRPEVLRVTLSVVEEGE